MKKILIIDDDSEDRLLMQKAFEKSGINAEIKGAESAENGIALINQFEPHIVILDTVLPGINGFAACRQIKEFNASIKVIICTGMIDAVDAGKARSSGADDYCVKTEDYEEVVKALHSL